MEILSPWSIQNNWTVFNSTSAFFIVVSGVKFVSAFGNCNVIQIRRLLFFFFLIEISFERTGQTGSGTGRTLNPCGLRLQMNGC